MLVVVKDRRERGTDRRISDQNSSPEAPPRSMVGREKKEQRKCQERSECQRSDGEE